MDEKEFQIEKLQMKLDCCKHLFLSGIKIFNEEVNEDRIEGMKAAADYLHSKKLKRLSIFNPNFLELSRLSELRYNLGIYKIFLDLEAL